MTTPVKDGEKPKSRDQLLLGLPTDALRYIEQLERLALDSGDCFRCGSCQRVVALDTINVLAIPNGVTYKCCDCGGVEAPCGMQYLTGRELRVVTWGEPGAPVSDNIVRAFYDAPNGKTKCVGEIPIKTIHNISDIHRRGGVNGGKCE